MDSSKNLIRMRPTILSLIIFLAINSPLFAFSEQKFTATMSGNDEIPPVDTNATGAATFMTLNNDTLLEYNLNVTGLTDITAAHIHSGNITQNGDIIVDLLNNSKHLPTKIGMVITGNITGALLIGSDLTNMSMSDLVSAMSNGDTYTNVHTFKNPTGEIRGQIGKSEAAN